MIRRWLVLISGFRQDYSRATGMDRLFDQVLGFDGRVEYWQWDEDWRAQAAYMHRHSHFAAEITVAAYSWGAGYGALRLAEEMRELGRRINLMVLCDPVYRRPWVPRWFNLLPMSLARGRTIKYPSTVNHIEWFYQTADRPAGHRPTGAKVISAGAELPYTHPGMEDSQEFHRAVLRVL